MLQISALSFPLTPAIRQHVENRLHGALGDMPVARVSVRLLDVNGMRGGVDKQCRVNVKVGRRESAVAVSTSADLYDAVDKAASRVRTVLRRSRSRRRSSRRAFSPSTGLPAA